MKKFRYLLLLPVIITAVPYFYSCDDTGVNPNAFRQGQITITLTNLKTLNLGVDGSYQLWIVFDTSAEFIRNVGSFNINPGGNIVDPATGDPKSFALYADTIYAAYAKYCFVTVGTDIGNQNNPHLIAGTFAHYGDSVATDLALNDPNAVGPQLDPVIGNALAWYILSQPTTNNAACSSGVWYCDVSGNPYLPMGALSGSSRWIYEGWAADTSNPSSPIYYSTGRFYDPYSPDLDGAGPCAGTNSFYNKPGQDWVNNFPEGCPGILNLLSGRFQVFVTIEPANEQGTALSTPFFAKLFWQTHVDVTVGCESRDNIFNQSLYGRLPRGHINILR
jgi:hypothetical protein